MGYNCLHLNISKVQRGRWEASHPPVAVCLQTTTHFGHFGLVLGKLQSHSTLSMHYLKKA